MSTDMHISNLPKSTFDRLSLILMTIAETETLKEKKKKYYFFLQKVIHFTVMTDSGYSNYYKCYFFRL